jgi:heat shock protein HslJ
MRSQLLVLTAAAAMALAACGGAAATPQPTSPPQDSPAAPEPTAPTSGATAGGLAGTSWVGTKADPASPADPTLIRLSFEDAALSGSGGCNQMGGEYKVVDGVMTVGAMMSTEMACEEKLMAQDQWLATLLNGATVTADATTLTLANAGVTLTLADKAAGQPAPAVEGTTWVLNGIGDASTTSSVPASVTASILIKGGQAEVAFGCNTGGGSVTVSDTSLTFGPLMMTMMMCQNPAGAVETAMSGVLQGEVPYTVSGDVLTLTGANGTTLTFTAKQG